MNTRLCELPSHEQKEQGRGIAQPSICLSADYCRGSAIEPRKNAQKLGSRQDGVARSACNILYLSQSLSPSNAWSGTGCCLRLDELPIFCLLYSSDSSKNFKQRVCARSIIQRIPIDVDSSIQTLTSESFRGFICATFHDASCRRSWKGECEGR